MVPFGEGFATWLANISTRFQRLFPVGESDPFTLGLLDTIGVLFRLFRFSIVSRYSHLHATTYVRIPRNYRKQNTTMHGTYFLIALRHEKICIVEAARKAHCMRKRLVLDDQRPRKGTCSNLVTRSTCSICLRLYLPGQLTDGIHRYRQHTHDAIHRCEKTRRDMAGSSDKKHITDRFQSISGRLRSRDLYRRLLVILMLLPPSSASSSTSLFYCLLRLH